MPPRLTKRSANLTLAILACIALIFSSLPFTKHDSARAAPDAAPAAFSSTEFEQLWKRTDGLVADGQVQRSWLWGPAPGASLTEPYAQAAGGNRAVQYFDKARMELNPAVTDPTSQWRVTTGLLVNEMVQGKVQVGDNQFRALAPSTEAVAGDNGAAGNPRYADFTGLVTATAPDRTGQGVNSWIIPGSGPTTGSDGGVRYAAFVRETGHNIPDVFMSYMTSTGAVQDQTGKVVTGQVFDWVYVMGYPITEPYWVNIKVSGAQYTALVQLYQRRVLTYVPAFASGWQVQMGNSGQAYYDWRYKTQASAGPPSAAQTPSASASNAAPPSVFPTIGGFVGMDGQSFTYRGSKVKLKGTNYWMRTQPFVGTWSDWDGQQVLAELKQAHDMGANTVRVGIPFNHFYTMDLVWGGDKSMKNLGPGIIDEMTQFLQIAASYKMKVIFVLFEWYDNYPSPGSAEDHSVITYLQGIVGHFANDDRILAWDLHNEPDNYDEWQGGHQDKVIKWLQRVYGSVRALDQRHLVTVGVGNFRNLWQPAADGTTLMSFIDFAAFHCYDAGALQSQIAEIKAHTQKPILLEEMGWPTNPGEKPPAGAVMNERQQNYLYTTMLAASKSADIAGVVQWTLFDFPAKSTNGGKFASYEENFGLVRLDGSLKPAAGIFSSGYQSVELPSDTVTNLKLTKAQ